MIIIGFTHKTSKILPRIFCRNFRHCAPIIVMLDGNMQMFQFVRRGQIESIPINMRDINILHKHGWHFVYLPISFTHNKNLGRARTCVEMTRWVLGIKKRILTPDGLYKTLALSGGFIN